LKGGILLKRDENRNVEEQIADQERKQETNAQQDGFRYDYDDASDVN